MSTSAQLAFCLVFATIALVPTMVVAAALATIFVRWVFGRRGPTGWSRYYVKVDGSYVVLLAPRRDA